MTEKEILYLFRMVNCYDNLEQLSETTGLSKSTLLGGKNGAYLSNKALRAMANAFGITLNALVLSFRFLQDLEFDKKEDRQRALIHILSISAKE